MVIAGEVERIAEIYGEKTMDLTDLISLPEELSALVRRKEKTEACGDAGLWFLYIGINVKRFNIRIVRYYLNVYNGIVDLLYYFIVVTKIVER